MIEPYNDERWNAFENSGRIADYLEYRGVGVKKLPVSKGAQDDAHNDGGSRDLLER